MTMIALAKHTEPFPKLFFSIVLSTTVLLLTVIIKKVMQCQAVKPHLRNVVGLAGPQGEPGAAGAPGAPGEKGWAAYVKGVGSLGVVRCWYFHIPAGALDTKHFCAHGHVSIFYPHIKTERDPMRPCNFHAFLIWGLSGTQGSFSFWFNTYFQSPRTTSPENQKSSKKAKKKIWKFLGTICFTCVFLVLSFSSKVSWHYYHQVTTKIYKVSAQWKNKPRLIIYYIFHRNKYTYIPKTNLIDFFNFSISIDSK